MAHSSNLTNYLTNERAKEQSMNVALSLDISQRISYEAEVDRD